MGRGSEDNSRLRKEGGRDILLPMGGSPADHHLFSMNESRKAVLGPLVPGVIASEGGVGFHA